MSTYARQPIAFVAGEGAWLTDDQGRRYLDAVGGLAVAVLGHAHPAVARTLAEQGGTLVHTSNLYKIPAQERLARKLVEISGMDSAFFGNSGGEANECAIKIARKHGHERGIKEPCILVMDGAFHGRTLATLSASGSRRVQAGFEPLVQGFIRAPYDDMETLRHIAAKDRKVVAALVEPILGEGGVQVPAPGYLQELRKLCDQQGWLLMLDEIQTGNGRTGSYFAYQEAGILPDLVTLAKGLANGVPMGVCLARGPAAEVLGPGNHGSTFGGNPLSCAVALTVLEVMEKQQLPARAKALGERMMQQFRDRLGGLNIVKDIRGQGLMIGIELDSPCADLVGKALERELLLNVTKEKVIRLLPPLILTDDEAGQIVSQVCELVESV